MRSDDLNSNQMRRNEPIDFVASSVILEEKYAIHGIHYYSYPAVTADLVMP